MKSRLLEGKVKKGIKWLDEDAGDDWASRIDTEKLDLEDDDDCVLGQLYGTYNSQMKLYGYKKFIKLGFHFRPRHRKDKNWNKLNSIWLDKIKERQCCNGVNGVATV